MGDGNVKASKDLADGLNKRTLRFTAPAAFDTRVIGDSHYEGL